MDLAALITELRENRLDDTVKRYLWSDEELTGYLNDAVRQVCIRRRTLVESVDPAVCHYTLASGVRLFKLHPAVISVRALRMTDSVDGTHRNHLEGVTAKWMRKRSPCWETWDNGCPNYWIPDYQQGAIWLDRGHDNAHTVDLTVWRAPLEAELLSVDDMDAEPVVDELFHLDLCDWAEYRAFSKKDAETLDNGRAGNAYSSFEAKIGPLPDAVSIRLWGVSKRRGVRAHYV